MTGTDDSGLLIQLVGIVKELGSTGMVVVSQFVMMRYFPNMVKSMVDTVSKDKSNADTTGH